jgi:hypothetical protein
MITWSGHLEYAHSSKIYWIKKTNNNILIDERKFQKYDIMVDYKTLETYTIKNPELAEFERKIFELLFQKL